MRRVILRLLPVAVLFQGGCLAAFERNIDLVFAPDAFENTIRLSNAPLGLLGAFLRLL